MAKGVGDVLGLDTVPAPFVVVVVTEDGSGRRGTPIAQAEDDAAQRFSGAEARVGGGSMANLFASDGILLVGELQGRVGDPRDEGRVIHRCRWGVVHHVTKGEMDVAQLKGLAAGADSGRLKVLGGAEQPEEGNNDEVDGMLVEGTVVIDCSGAALFM